MVNETQVYRYAGALFIVDERIDAGTVAIKTQDENGVVYWLNPSQWAAIAHEHPHIQRRVNKAPRAASVLAHQRLTALYAKVGSRPITADDFAADKAEGIQRVR